MVNYFSHTSAGRSVLLSSESSVGEWDCHDDDADGSPAGQIDWFSLVCLLCSIHHNFVSYISMSYFTTTVLIYCPALSHHDCFNCVMSHSIPLLLCRVTLLCNPMLCSVFYVFTVSAERYDPEADDDDATEARVSERSISAYHPIYAISLSSAVTVTVQYSTVIMKMILDCGSNLSRQIVNKLLW